MDNELFQQAIEKSPSMVVITNINGEFVYVNPKFTTVTGWHLDEIIGKKTNILKSGELSREYYEKMWSSLLAGKEWKGEFHNKKKNGEMYWISSSISSVMDSTGKIIRFIAVQEDITNVKIAQEQIVKSQTQIDELNKFQQLVLETIPDGIVIFDTKGKILFFNKAIQNLSLFNSFELQTNNFLELVDSPELLNIIMNKQNLDPELLVDYELNLIPKRGDPLPIKMTLVELNKDRYLVLIHDLRIEKKNEQYIEDFSKIIAQETYITIYRQSNLGPEIYLSDKLHFSKTDKNIIETKLGVYFITAIGQGGNLNKGLFGPLPFPDSTDYESIIYSCLMKDIQNSDPRSKGFSYCLFIVTFPKKYEPYYANRHYITQIFEKFTLKFDQIQKITIGQVSDLKISLIR